VRIRGKDTTPTHRRAWWLKKLEGNAARDKLHQHAPANPAGEASAFGNAK